MKIASIDTMYSSYYYNPNIIARLKTVKEITKVIETTKANTYQTNLYDNSAEYVKHAYEVSFRPLEMMNNLSI